MSLYAFPYGSIDNDRLYDDGDFIRYFAAMLSPGVFIQNDSNALAVTATGDGLNISVRAGSGNYDGRLLGLDGEQIIDLTSYVDARLDRIVRVVLRDNRAARVPELVIIAGTPAASPVAPAIVRNGDYKDLCLGQILIPAGASTLTQSAITDTRPDTTICGFVRCLAEKIDLNYMVEQLAAWIAEQQAAAAAEIRALETAATGDYADFTEWLEQFKTGTTVDFEEWVASLHEILSTEAAGNLQLEIDAINARLDSVKAEAAILGAVYLGACYLVD